MIEGTDVAIVGGGVTGCCIALGLARDGLEVALLDQHDLHTQASGSNAGNIHQQLLTAHSVRNRGWAWVEHNAQTVRLNVAAGRIWTDLARALDCDVELRFLGGLMVAETEADLAVIERKVALEKRWGGTGEIVSRQELLRLAPYLAEDLAGGVFCREEGKVNPLLATAAIARAAVAGGARVLRRHKVLGANRDGNSFVVVTSRGTIRCSRLVLAAGPQSAELAALLGVTVPVTPRIIQTAATEAAEPIIHHLLYHASRPLTMKQVANGNVLIGGGWAGLADTASGHPTVTRQSLAGSAWVAQRVAPAVGGLRLLRAWAAYIFQAPDGIPICGGVPGTPGLFLAIPNSFGFTLGPLLGQVLTALITGRETPLDADFLRVDRDYDAPELAGGRLLV